MKGRYEGIGKQEIDPVVDDRIERAIEQLEEHIPPTMAHYESFLKSELEWVESEKRAKTILTAPLPG